MNNPQVSIDPDLYNSMGDPDQESIEGGCADVIAERALQELLQGKTVIIGKAHITLDLVIREIFLSEMIMGETLRSMLLGYITQTWALKEAKLIGWQGEDSRAKEDGM